MNELFHKTAVVISTLMGSSSAFLAALLGVILWFIIGSFNGMSDSWQIFIQTVTAIITFLMVFLIQNAQNRDARAIHIKLDELIKSSKNARNAMVDIEELPGDELEQLHNEFKEFHEKCEKELIKRGRKLPSP
ncbi:MAG: low affinity iron permease family protein [Candidatus Daviesbacteria bacterium]|nr:low affinity iron permease family protein [Candidatus Daviesbacteria bacterium]